MRSFLVISLLMCLMMACRSGSHFTTRKYMSGRYVSGPARLHHVKVLEANTSRQGRITAFHDKADLQSSSKQDVFQVSYKQRGSEIAAEKRHKVRQPYISIRSTIRTAKKPSLQKQVKAVDLKKIRSQKTPSWAEKKPISVEALASVILSGFGLVVYVAILYSLGFFSFTYLYIPLMVLGFISLILGVIFGILAVKKYNREKRNEGNARKTNKVLGILGFCMGLAGIVTILMVCGLLAFINTLQ